VALDDINIIEAEARQRFGDGALDARRRKVKVFDFGAVAADFGRNDDLAPRERFQAFSEHLLVFFGGRSGRVVWV
jgi:hypothetical protein